MSTTLIPHRLRTGLVLGALVAVAALAPSAAQAAGSTSALCVNRLTLTISPGFSLIPTSGTETTNGDVGAILCVGAIRGHRITGPGSIGVDTTYVASGCLSEFSSGVVRVTIPTTAGPERIDGALTVRRTALAVSVTVNATDTRFSGIGVAVPTVGACLLTPLQHALIIIAGSLSNA
jgi:hypothetical protein